MAALVLLAPKILVGAAWTGTAPGAPGTQTVSGTITSSVDMSAMIQQVAIPLNVNEIDASNFGSGGYKINLAGLKDATVQLTFNQDFAASQVDATIWTTLVFGATVYIDVNPTTAARSATNPSYVFAVVVGDYTPITGKVGDLVTPSVTWTVTGQFARLTS